MSLPLVIQTETLEAEPAAWLAERTRLVACGVDDPRFPGLLREASGLVVRTYTLVNEQLLAAAPGLKVVARAGVGLDNIDVPACRRRGIQVVSTPDANTQAVVEYVLFLLGDVFRPRQALATGECPTGGQWHRLRAEPAARRQLNELTIGILGLGRVGGRLARVLTTIGARVTFHDLVETAAEREFAAERVAVEDVFRADVVTIHVDGRPSNRHVVNAQRLGQMRPDVVFINTSRGFVIENAALADFLRANPRAAALLDVHEPEPFGPDYPLLGLPNAVLYPHLASRTRTAMLNMSWVVKDVAAVLEGREPEFPAWR